MGPSRDDNEGKEPIEVEWPRLRGGQILFTYFHFSAAHERYVAICAQVGEFGLAQRLYRRSGARPGVEHRG